MVDVFIERCKRTEDIQEFIVDGVLTTTNISKAWLLTHVESDLRCWISRQRWVVDYLENVLERHIEFYDRYVVNKFHVESLLNAYDIFISRLAPLYNPENRTCVGVSDETVEFLEEELGIDLTGVDLGKLYFNIVDTYDDLKDIIFEFTHTDFTYLVVVQE